MADQVSQEAMLILQGYVDGRISNAELADWLAGAEYDSSISESERDELAGIRLVLIEAQEGRREQDEVLASVLAVVASAQPGKRILAERAEANTSWFTRSTLTAGRSPVQRAGISI